MTVTVKDICDEVDTILSALFAGDFLSIEVANVPRLDEESVRDNRCYIVGGGRTSVQFSRGMRKYTYTILVFVVGRVLDPNSATSPDAEETAYDFQELALEVSEALENVTLPTSKLKENGITVTLYDADQLNSQHVSQSLITVTFDGGLRSA